MLKKIGIIFSACLFTSSLSASELEEVNIFCKSEINPSASYYENKSIKILGETKTIVCSGKNIKIFSISKDENHFFRILGKLTESCQKGIQYDLENSAFYNILPVNNASEILSSFAIENTFKKDQFLFFSPLGCN
ncbi:hypothetical protein QEJ31_04725 [Pigmentibacter sp. JX0631]|uniref:hypothetical protein n=1 Tax=Pigmentibacter sp. JX0631 TaxID=2976982 RepID=UPI00246855AE|nr:hypothetical protein [Pigmentibacter sp. JX0631]WGL60901.1 hypothetical protein QEJ31_04725 [Pigmentibacter sp. JX0631]